MFTNFHTQNVINQSNKVPCKQRAVMKFFIYTQNKLHMQIHTNKHTQVHSVYEDDIQLLFELQNDSMGLIHHQ